MVVRDKGTAKYQDACHTPLIFLSSLETYSGLWINTNEIQMIEDKLDEELND